ncbi:MAG: hypothetical protein IJJ77_05730 [Paludibacteraceae bacterium]|nr:hypothetical protein [Paludibacteraceae bacterium]
MKMRFMFATLLGVAMTVSVNAQSLKTNSYGLYLDPSAGNLGKLSIGYVPTTSTANYSLYVKGNTFFNGAVTATSLKLNSGLTVGGNATLKGVTATNLTVSGSATINGDFLAAGGSNRIYNGLQIYSTNVNNRTNMFLGSDGEYGLMIKANGYRSYTNLKFIATDYTFLGSTSNTLFTLNSSTMKLNTALDVTGKITCHKEIEVASVLKADQIKTNDLNVEMNNAADYVFDDEYNLLPLSEVEDYVKENKHLPGVPSAAEMAENGMNVAQMSNLLLEKIEELTLHMIQLEKENKALKEEVKSLKK